MAKLAPLDLRSLVQRDDEELPASRTEPNLDVTPITPRTTGSQPPKAEGSGLAQLAQRSPRLVDDELSRIRRDQRTIMSFNNMPVTIKQRFDDEAKRRKMGKKELFIEMMRQFGIDVPPYELLDGRRQY